MDINKMVETAIVDAFTTLPEFLRFQARFHKADFINTALLWKQCPEATRVRSKDAWASVGRVPRKGAKPLSVVGRRDSAWVLQEERYDISQTDGWDLRLPETVRFTAEDIVRAIPDVFNVRAELCKGVRGEFYDPEEDVLWIGQMTPRETVQSGVTALAMKLIYPAHVAGEMPSKELYIAADGAGFVVCRHFDILVDLRRSIMLTGDIEALMRIGCHTQLVARQIIDRLTEYVKQRAGGVPSGKKADALCAAV